MKSIDLPKIKLSDFDAANPQAFEDLRRISREIGTFYLLKHGIDLSLCKRIHQLSRQFFALPQASKERISMINSAQFRGYSSQGGEYTDGGKDWREQIDIGTEREALK